MLLRDRRLLVVDGDGERGRAIGEAAEGRGARVHVCATLEEGLAALQVWPADAAVVALPWGEGDSTALCGRLRRDGVRVVALATADLPAVADQAGWLGAARVLPLPLQLPELLEELGRSPAALPDEAPDDEPLHPEFESLVFSWARPALDESVPAAFGPRRTEPLAGPLPGPKPPPLPGAAPRLLPRGSLSEVLLPRLLGVLARAEATGSLELVQEPVRRLLLLESGRPVFAISNQPAERFGPRCLREGILGADQLSALQRALPAGASLGQVLVERGALSPERRLALVRAQVEEVVWAAFSWREGAYRVSLGPLPSRERLDLGLRPGPFLLQGVRSLPMARLRAELPPHATLGPPRVPPLGTVELSREEVALLGLADGTKAVSDLEALSPLPADRTLALLLAASCLGLLEPRPPGLASTRRMGFM